jgi:Icc-related predicted phosphoesterase
MRVCFTSDLHGHARLYAQLTELLQVERPDLLILGGDLFVDGDLDDPLGTQVEYVNSQFLPLLRTWRAAAPSLQIACILGNHDWRCTEQELSRHNDQHELVLLNERRAWKLREVSFVGYSCTPPTPYWVKDFERLDRPADPIPETGGAVWHADTGEVRKADPREHFTRLPSMAQDLAAAAAPASDRWILVAHAPPHDSKLDWLPNVPYPVGSRAVRAFIETRRPLLSLHGHIHESPEITGEYAVTVGSTLAVNPGQSPTRLQAVVFDTDAPRETLRRTVQT